MNGQAENISKGLNLYKIIKVCFIQVKVTFYACLFQVYFPDVEKAEWLNKMVKQMWPFVGEYMKKVLKTSVEPSVQNSLPKSLTPFRFDKIDLGDIVSMNRYLVV